jgi:hypothetical protein
VFQIDKFLQNGGCFFCGVDEPWYLKHLGQIYITVVDLSESRHGGCICESEGRRLQV